MSATRHVVIVTNAFRSEVATGSLRETVSGFGRSVESIQRRKGLPWSATEGRSRSKPKAY